MLVAVLLLFVCLSHLSFGAANAENAEITEMRLPPRPPISLVPIKECLNFKDFPYNVCIDDKYKKGIKKVVGKGSEIITNYFCPKAPVCGILSCSKTLKKVELKKAFNAKYLSNIVLVLNYNQYKYINTLAGKSLARFKISCDNEKTWKILKVFKSCDNGVNINLKLPIYDKKCWKNDNIVLKYELDCLGGDIDIGVIGKLCITGLFDKKSSGGRFIPSIEENLKNEDNQIENYIDYGDDEQEIDEDEYEHDEDENDNEVEADVQNDDEMEGDYQMEDELNDNEINNNLEEEMDDNFEDDINADMENMDMEMNENDENEYEMNADIDDMDVLDDDMNDYDMDLNEEEWNDEYFDGNTEILNGSNISQYFNLISFESLCWLLLVISFSGCLLYFCFFQKKKKSIDIYTPIKPFN